MDSLQYVHSTNESDLRETFGIPDNTAPAIPQYFNITSSQFPVELIWDEVSDPSGISHYKVFKDDQFYDYTLTIPYKDYNVAAGQTYQYKISVMDRAGNESGQTANNSVQVPSTIEKALNGNFDEGKNFWKLYSYDANAIADFQIDSTFMIDGKYSAKVDVNQSSGTNWHIRFLSHLKLYAQRKYKNKFSAKSSANKNIQYWIQQSNSPYQILKSGALIDNVRL